MGVPIWFPYDRFARSPVRETGENRMSLNYSGDPDADFTVSFDDAALCTISVDGDFIPELIRTIAQHIYTERENGQAVAGILLVMQTVQVVSLIRLSGLLDLLSRYETPIAVVLETTSQQKRLVDLLHQTMPFRDCIAYFDTTEAARAFLTEKLAAG